MPETTRWQDIFNHLKDKGFDVFPPSYKYGECKEKYIVVKDSGTASVNEISSTRTLFDVMCYVPKDRFSTLDGFVTEVKTSMDELYPMIRPVHFETPSYYDEAVKAFMVSVQFCNYKQKVRI